MMLVVVSARTVGALQDLHDQKRCQGEIRGCQRLASRIKYVICNVVLNVRGL